MNWTTEKRRISDLIPTVNNPRILNEKQHADLKRSLKKFNLVEIPAINQDGQILAGHQRLKIMAALGRGDEEIDVRVPDRQLSKKECDEYLIRSNKNTGEWDMDELANSFDLDDLKDWGFEDAELGLGKNGFGDTSTDRDNQGVNSTWDQVKTSGFVKIIIGDLESSIDKDLAIKIIGYCESQFEENNIPIKDSLKTILQSGSINV